MRTDSVGPLHKIEGIMNQYMCKDILERIRAIYLSKWLMDN